MFSCLYSKITTNAGIAAAPVNVRFGFTVYGKITKGRR
jgi:hypothetical protein